MMGYVEVVLRRNRGWPWPDSSWGLDPMFGEDGWCHACGVPKHPQTGSVVLRRKELNLAGGWVPNWRFDVYCLSLPLASEVAERFGLELRRVASPKGEVLAARQIVIDSSATKWFEPADLARLITPIHGEASKTCPECGVTRWLPVGMDVLPLPPPSVLENAPPVVASPEWFGDGKQSFHEIIWRRDLADYLVNASPKDFKLQELSC